MMIDDGMMRKFVPQHHVNDRGGKDKMALVSMKEMMIKAKKEGYAIGQFNINNLE